jgi:hypothetical protein
MQPNANLFGKILLLQKVGVTQLPLLISPTITDINLYHVLVDGAAALNLISLVAVKRL